MKTMFQAIRLTLMLLIMCAVVYPVLIWGIAQIAPYKGQGEKIVDKNGREYYVNIGQRFDRDIYFHSRPSAINYNAAASRGSNKGPNDLGYLKQIRERINNFKSQNPNVGVPVDMVTASSSGLDPDISIEAANVQINRIAKSRNVEYIKIKELINKYAEQGIFGPSKINVLKLNIELDKLK